MPFGLYEAGGEDETFIRVDVARTYEDITHIERDRHANRIERDTGPIAETRIVPATHSHELPMHASVEELKGMIRKNNEMFPTP